MAGHFFTEPNTPRWISELSRPGPLTIYVGLGGTIDRTGTTWDQLVLTMLEKNKVSRADGEALIGSSTNERSATTAEILFRRAAEDDDQFESLLRTSIRETLYSPRRHLRGRLLWNVAALAYANSSQGESTVLVTPNYDEYLHEELEHYFETKRAIFAEDLSTSLQGELVVTGDDFKLPESAFAGRNITCVHIHGLVASNPTRDQGTPVVGELTYNATRKRTTEILRDLFRARNLLVVGSSLTDGPLCEALIDEAKLAKRQTRRHVLSPLQAPEWQNKKLRPLLDKRHSALGVTTVHPHHFGQVGQFLSEVAGAMVRGDGEEQYANKTHPARYHERLRGWWKAQQPRLFNHATTPKVVHEMLSAYLAEIRSVVDFDHDEEIKLELWGRHDPNHGRRLRLLGTSIGPWNDIDTAHYADIAADDDYFAARVFCMAAPMIHSEDENYRGRWKSYVGVPIWLDRSTLQLPVGVAVLASMRPYARGDARLPDSGDGPESAVRVENLTELRRSFEYMEALGREILTADGDLASARRRLQRYLKDAAAGRRDAAQ